MKTVKILLREGIFDHEKNQKEQEHKACVDCQPSWLGLCGTLLVGTTAAWFTDSVTSASNVIKSGNLDVKLEYKTGDSDWAEVTKDTTVFDENTLWEPGRVEVVNFNATTLAIAFCRKVFLIFKEWRIITFC